ncbi:hypothetical protein CAPTEDRAFT_172150 [Capitella teleta]|uniref:NAD-dependent protein deacylase n=1 Tax=Capitella teleta TaxID=283909 RepID=R7VC11_CAPTE|nr:hypothetical protein CAPTEDRAFT_172150 [Capitella teleta]|eukprot:ELU13851.1 hypothetical protein CAPTEDRAFT_172150 [Capitella teleta]
MRLTSRLCQIPQLQFVPRSKPATKEDVLQLQDFVDGARKLVVLTGAGLSTESGIPDYRSDKVGLYARTNRRPVDHSEFMRNASSRQRYWARNFVGWPIFSSHLPNASHEALYAWEKAEKLQWLITQNVDSLHHKAGSSRVSELHGCTHRVKCMDCHALYRRSELQHAFIELNPGWDFTTPEIAPDGDVLLTDEQVKKFKVLDCQKCGGILKPDVVFFGDNVIKPKVEFIYDQIRAGDGLLVIGSSLFVYSGYRFALRAVELGKPLAILNIGETRADHLVNLKVSALCGEILPQIRIS